MVGLQCFALLESCTGHLFISIPCPGGEDDVSALFPSFGSYYNFHLLRYCLAGR